MRILRMVAAKRGSDTDFISRCAIVERVPRAPRPLLIALASLAGLMVVLVGVWAIDMRAHSGQVLRGVTLAGHPVAGLNHARLERVVAKVAVEVPDRDVEVRAPDGGFTTEAKALGVRVAEPATVRSALAVGRRGSVAARVVGWLRSFFAERRAPLRISINSSDVYATVAAKDPGPRRPPTEPSIALAKGKLSAVPGKPGRGIDPADVMAGLPRAATDGRTMVVKVGRGEVPPRIEMAVAEHLAAELQTKVDVPLPVTAGEEKTMVPVATQRSWIASRADGARLRPIVDGKHVLEDLGKLLLEAGEPAVETAFSVEGGAVKIHPGKSGTRCCAEGAVALVERALFDDASTPPPPLPLTERKPKLSESEAVALRIVEPIASFTTKHPARQPRVGNIHRISDLLRGVVIRPKGTFSVNDAVGKRTRDKGFVPAPVIEDGKFAESVGGGISQFATTLFNAAFEGGLEFAEYQSHSIYISRYPYGREATLSFPAPDLAIRNPSPYGVLVWPTYTDTSITVTLYSTKFAEVRQTGQSEGRRGACKRVTTERTRTWLSDGRVEVDKVFATYRPREGVNC